MIGLAENWGAECAEEQESYMAAALPVAELLVIVHHVRLGSQRCAVLSTHTGRLMGIAAARLSPELSAWIQRSDFEAPMTVCATMEAALRCGFVFVRYDFAQAATRDGRFLIRLRERLAGILETETEGSEK